MCPRFRVLINITARAFGHTPMGFMEPFEAIDFLLVNGLWWILITFKAIHGLAPKYLRDLFTNI